MVFFINNETYKIEFDDDFDELFSKRHIDALIQASTIVLEKESRMSVWSFVKAPFPDMSYFRYDSIRSLCYSNGCKLDSFRGAELLRSDYDIENLITGNIPLEFPMIINMDTEQ